MPSVPPLDGLALFFSYSHADLQQANQICEHLKQAGAKVWLDHLELQVGDNIPRELLNILRKSDGALVLLTPNSIQSPWVLIELGAAWITIPVYPICDAISSGEMPEPLKEISACTVKEVESRLIPALARLALSLHKPDVLPHVDYRQIAVEAIRTTRLATRSEEVAPLLARALSQERSVRREAHIAIRQVPNEIRKGLLDAMLVLTKHGDDHVRGEAYYCLGQIPLDTGEHHQPESFFLHGLYDPSTFVRACCANVLRNFCPLEKLTVERLQECFSFTIADTREDTDALGLVYLAASAIDAHRSSISRRGGA